MNFRLTSRFPLSVARFTCPISPARTLATLQPLQHVLTMDSPHQRGQDSRRPRRRPRGGQNRPNGNRFASQNGSNGVNGAHSNAQDVNGSAMDLDAPSNGADTGRNNVSAPAVPIASDAARFADLNGSGNIVHPSLIQTITDDLKFEHMSPVQSATIRELLPPSRADCLVQAKTGTGKTLAFLLPALQTLLTGRAAAGGRGPRKTTSLLVISPTRELAMQIANEAKNLLGRFPDYPVRVAIGGTNKATEERHILSSCPILVATPGRLLDHMSNPNIVNQLRQLDTFVLDEADRLLDMGFMKPITDIVAQLPNKQDVPRQSMLFSATIAPHVEKVANLVLNRGYKFISTVPAGEANTHERVPQLLVTVPTFSDVAAAMVGGIRGEARQQAEAQQSFKAIIFAPTAALASFYGDILSALPDMPPVSTLHSRISQSRRTKITQEYRLAKSAILVATDVIARGMDFPNVTTVFQVGIPSDKESYIHRLGRTARADAEGRGIFIVCEAEGWFPKWTLKDITFVPHQVDAASAAGEVERIATAMDDQTKAKVYQAWLGYYKNHLKAFKWTVDNLVANANQYAQDGLGSPERPPIGKSTVGKMGLRGVKGLNVVADAARPARHGQRGGGGGGRR